MKRIRSVWPTVLAAAGSAVIASLSIISVAAAGGEKSASRYCCPCELEYKISSAYQESSSYQNSEEGEDDGVGEFHYLQKYVAIYSAPDNPTADAQAAEGVKIEGPVVAPAAENGVSYIFQYEEVNEEKDGYEYALPQDIYGSSVMPSPDILKLEDILDSPSWCDVDRYLEEHYTDSPYTVERLPEAPAGENPALKGLIGDQAKESLALFTWNPQELLTFSDHELLRVLAVVSDRSPGVRRAVFSDYIASLPVEAVVLSQRYQAAGGLDMQEMADDLSQATAFLACFRLIENGELAADEALELLLKSQSHRSQSWNLWVNETTGYEGTIALNEVKPGDQYATQLNDSESTADFCKSATNPLLKVLVITAAGSLERLGGKICDLSRAIKNLY